MTFLAAWNLVWTWLIVSACLVTIIEAARGFRQRRGLDRWVPGIVIIILTWVGGNYLYFWGLRGITIPPEIFRPGIFALVVTVLALLVGVRHYEH